MERDTTSQTLGEGRWDFLRRRLSRVTSSGRFIPEIDGLRFIAISLVVLFHINNFVAFRTGFPLDAHHQVAATDQRNGFNYVISHGDVGVPLFFVISGFILGVPFAAHQLSGRPKVGLRYYFLRRITRLEPPYLVALAISFVLLLLFFRGGNAVGVFGVDTLLTGIYLQNLATGGLPKVNTAYWSLEVEVQFYLLAPLLAGVFKIASRWHRRVFLVSVIVIWGLIQPWLPLGSRGPLSIVGQAQYFLAGFLLADIYTADWREQPPTFGPWTSFITLVGWPLLFVLLDQQFDTVRQAVLPLLIVGLYILVLGHSPGTRWLAKPLVTIVGGMCYSIYLLHFPIIFGVGRLADRFGPVAGNYTITFLIYSVPIVAAVLAVAVLFFITIERPCMDRRWPLRLLAWLRGKPATSAVGSQAGA